MKMLSLFSGIGGIDLAAQWAGIETVAFCEIEPFCQKVLKKHWPNVPIFEDVKKLGREALEDAGIGRVDIVAGGYPCQPYSLTGERKGHEDDRALWPEMFRIISEVRPDWVIGENVAGHVSLGLDNVLSDLESVGYSTQAFIVPACSVGGYHRRDRVFTVANIDSKRVERSIKKQIFREPHIPFRQIGKSFQEAERRFDSFESRLCRSLYGLPNGVDRIKALGNAVVPQQIYPIFAAIAEIERCKDAI
ncbi:DNA cytosine methyltransferase [Anaeromusa sp.]|uniref:DNA cytosine methyltransferase n=1 Tax=Anaeromusa sp. TaxID=1872520 RepID=UPI002626C2FE|nr:DNA cytosine methyltransferase [Anaeromusa sp.]MDD3156999.1 DNA cytosine methyltransferase [Anaeromusa sp.]